MTLAPPTLLPGLLPRFHCEVSVDLEPEESGHVGRRVWGSGGRERSELHSGTKDDYLNSGIPRPVINGFNFLKFQFLAV